MIIDNKTKEYIDKQPAKLQVIIKKLKRIIYKTLKDPSEEMKWGVLVYGNNKFYLAGMKDRVHMGFAICKLNKKEVANFEGSGKTMRHLKFHSQKDIDDNEIIKLIKLVNRKAECKVH